jgi:putative transposase
MWYVGAPVRQERGRGVSRKHHIVRCPKYPPFSSGAPIDARLKKLLTEIAKQHGMTLHAVEVMPDHVHIFVENDPTPCVAEIVNRFKGRTSRILRQEFPQPRLPALWSRSYFAATVGAGFEAQKGV